VCGAHEGKDAHGFPAVTLLGLTADRLAEVQGKVVSRCRDHVSPSIAPTVEELPTDDPARRVLVFTLVATGRAHALREVERTAYWVRVDSSTREARNGLLHRLLAARGDVPPWDERLATEATVDDLDPLAIRDTLVRMQVWSQAPELDHWLDPTVRISTFMLPLCGREPLTGVVRPRNFALLLFGREPQRFVPGAVSTFSKYPGTDRSEPYNESTWHGGTLVDQARQLLAHLQQEAIGITDKSSGGPENLQKYPSRALQEALINALVHRDYTSREPVRVVAYADRVEITSPGGLDPRADRERFLRGTASPVWRNRSLAWVFIRLQLAQSEGQGIPAIQRSLEAGGSPPATFTVTDDFVTCVVPAHPRGSRVRDVMAVEEHLFAGRFDAARDRLAPLLAQDPHDPP
jgi:ATP-dependent DNA helicase RecG